MAEPKPIADRLAELGASIGFTVTGDEPADDFDPTWSGMPLDVARANRWSARCPDRFTSAHVDDLDEILGPQVAEWCQTETPGNLVLLGGVGRGKTHAAIAAGRSRWENHGDDVLFRPVVELLDSLRPGTDDEDALTEAIDVDVLILDDLGAERPTDWTSERLFSIVNRRWMERRPIIGTSNLDPPSLETALGPRTYSRLVGDTALVLGVGGTDRRLGR